MYMNVYNTNEACSSNALIANTVTNVWQRTMPAVVAGTTLACILYTLRAVLMGKCAVLKSKKYRLQKPMRTTI